MLLLLTQCLAAAHANPAAEGPWRWKPLRPLRPSVEIVGNATGDASPYIVGGVEAEPHSRPWQVGIFVDDHYFCGGSVLSPHWVLTAAHCVQGAERVEVVAGAHDIRKSEPSQQTRESRDFFPHEHYNSSTIRNDIALVYLCEPLNWTAAISPALLPAPSSPDPSAGSPVLASGWGKQYDYSTGITRRLREVELEVEQQARCVMWYSPLYVTDDVICTRPIGGRGVCDGDSGGPLVSAEGAASPVLRGVTSFGDVSGCSAGPSAFTRVGRYLDWLEARTASYTAAHCSAGGRPPSLGLPPLLLLCAVCWGRSGL